MLSLAFGNEVYWVESHLSYQPNGEALVWRGMSPYVPEHAYKNIDRVEVSYDGGKNFVFAHLLTQIGVAYCGIDEHRKCFRALSEALEHAKLAGLTISTRATKARGSRLAQLARLVLPV